MFNKSFSLNLKIFLNSVFLFAAIFLLHSCNDKPSDLAVNLLPDTVSVKTISSLDTLLITGKTVYMPKLPIFNSGSVFIGKFEDITAVTLLNFAFLPDTLGNLTIEDLKSAKLTLYPDRYAFGDTLSGNYGFDIYRVNRRWTPDSTTYDSLMISPANYFDPIKIGTYDGRINLKDTIDPINIELPYDMIIDWLKTEMVLDTAKNTMVPKRIPNWGLAFIPKDNSTVINRFEASAPAKALASKITIEYLNRTLDSTVLLNLISGVDVTFLSTSVPDTSEIVVQNGLNYWTKLDFDMSMIPRFSGIHKAQLEFTLDPSRSRHGNVPLDSIISLALFENDLKSSFFDYTGGRLSGTNTYQFPSITSVSQYMNKYGGKFSLVLHPNSIVNQSRELERLTFFGFNHPDTTKRPMLKIIYSLNPAYLEPQK